MWRPVRTAAFVDVSNCSLWMQLEFPNALVQDYGAPEKVWLGYNFSSGSTHSDVQLMWFNKTATRIAESFMFEFTPFAPGNEWWMQKLASHVQPQDVVQGGNPWQHAVSGNVVFSSVSPSTPRPPNHPTPHIAQHSLLLSSFDAPLLAPILNSDGISSPSPLVPHTNIINASQVQGVAWNLFNNMFVIPHSIPFNAPLHLRAYRRPSRWNTNYIFWFPFAGVTSNNAAKFRFTIDVSNE